MSDSDLPVAASPSAPSSPEDAAMTCARRLRAAAAPSAREAARQIGDAAWTAADPAVAASLRSVDAEFASRIGPFEGQPATWRPPRASTVTPWCDFAGALAAGSVMAAALGAGRTTGDTWIDSDPVVAMTVIVSAVLAIALFAAGAVFAHRERATLRAQRYDSASVGRAAFVWVGVALGVLGVAGMIGRVVGDPLPTSLLALCCAIALVVVTFALAVRATREAGAGLAKALFIPREGARRALLSASADAQTQAVEVTASVDVDTRTQVDAAYRAGVTALIAGGALPKTTVDRLRAADPLAARFTV